jgi:hypothetical protein
MNRSVLLRVGLLFAASVVLVAKSRGAAIVWNGPPITFTKPGFADWTLPEFQDRITDSVWITRAGTEGIFNIRTETTYAHSLSPKDTEWAFGTTENYDSLTYQPWELWAALRPPDTVNKDAVLHLISEDIYIAVKFTVWGGAASGGTFTYVRSTAPVPEPANLAVISLGGLIALTRRRAQPHARDRRGLQKPGLPAGDSFSFRIRRAERVRAT